MFRSQLHQLPRFVVSSFSIISRSMASKSALVLIAEGSEEMEAVITVDVLRRGGVDVTLAGISGSDPVKCSRGVVVVPDKSLADVANQVFDAVVLPGGLGGADAFAASSQVGEVLKAQESSGRIVAAICAAPIALKAHGVGIGKKVTSHPSVKDTFTPDLYTYSDDRVVVHDHFITSRAPGTAFEFALKLLQLLVNDETVQKISAPMLIK